MKIVLVGADLEENLGPDGISVRWEADGIVDGDGREVRWTPEDAGDSALRAAVRSRGGIAVVSLRARSV